MSPIQGNFKNILFYYYVMWMLFLLLASPIAWDVDVQELSASPHEQYSIVDAVRINGTEVIATSNESTKFFSQDWQPLEYERIEKGMYRIHSPSGTIIAARERNLLGMAAVQAEPVPLLVSLLVLILVAGGFVATQMPGQDEREQQLRQYVEYQLSMGKHVDAVRDGLLRLGWNRDTVDFYINDFFAKDDVHFTSTEDAEIQLRKYMEKARKEGLTNEEILRDLQEAGWSPAQVTKLLK